METEILKQLIKQSGLSQREFAAKAGKPETRISEWLSGARNPKLSAIIEMANKLNFDISFSVKKNKKK